MNKSWRQHPTKQQLYGHLPPIMKTIKVRWTRHAGHCWRGRDKLISDVLLWTPSHERTKAGQPAWTYIQQLYEDTGYSPEDLPEAMKDREEWRESVRDIHAGDTTRWWWWLFLCDNADPLNLTCSWTSHPSWCSFLKERSQPQVLVETLEPSNQDHKEKKNSRLYNHIAFFIDSYSLKQPRG